MNMFIVKDSKMILDRYDVVTLYLTYFSPGIRLPYATVPAWMRRSIHAALKVLISVAHTSGLSRVLFPRVRLATHAHIIIEGNGAWKNRIEVIPHHGSYIVRKIVHNPSRYLAEKTYHARYFGRSSHLLLPDSHFTSPDTIEYPFMPYQSFERLLAQGTFDYHACMRHFILIKRALREMYGPGSTLIHGDLGTTNILIDGNRYYLVDYSDSVRSTYRYDLYVLLFSILSSLGKIKTTNTTLANYSYQSRSVLDLLDADENILKSLEYIFSASRAHKHPDLYTVSPEIP